MARRIIIILAVVLIAIALLAGWGIRVVEDQTALIVTRSESPSRLDSGIRWYPRGIARECSVPVRGGRLLFDEDIDFRDSRGETLQADVRFTYELPRTIGGPTGSWCETLQRLVSDSIGAWGAQRSYEQVAHDPRRSADELISHLAAALESHAIDAANVAARPIVSGRLAAVRSIPAVAEKAIEAPPVFFVGMDGADWQLLDQYMQAGLMPNLKQLVDEGARGPLETMHPALSPILWTTMMTGREPVEHGVLDFTRFNPVSGNKEPITSDERSVPAIWNMLTMGGKSVAAFGMWATYPAEPVRGILVSDRFFTFLFKEEERPPAVVFPPSREQWALDALQKVENEIGFDDVQPYLPWLTTQEYENSLDAKSAYENPVSALRRILVETEIYHRLALEWEAEHSPDLTILYLQGTDSIGHTFAAYAPPRQPSVTEEEFRRYSRVPERYFQHVDRLLGEYRDLVAKRNGVLMLASDHGFLWSEGRPEKLSSFEMATAAKWHRKEGIVLFWRPGGVSTSVRPSGSIVDVTPTLLALTGMPPGEALDGTVIPGAPAPSSGATISYMDHYEPFRIEPSAAAAEAVDDELAKLRALGYLGGGESDRAAPGSVEEGSTRTAGWYNNLGLIHQNNGNADAAIEAWEQALKIDPGLASAAWNLSDEMFDRGEYDRSDALLIQAAQHGLPERIRYIIGRAIGYQRDGQTERSLRLVSLGLNILPNEPELRMFRGRYRVELNDCRGAYDDFLAAQRIAPTNPAPYSSAGLAAMCMGNREEARRQFARSLQIDPQQPQLRMYLQQLIGEAVPR